MDGSRHEVATTTCAPLADTAKGATTAAAIWDYNCWQFWDPDLNASGMAAILPQKARQGGEVVGFAEAKQCPRAAAAALALFLNASEPVGAGASSTTSTVVPRHGCLAKSSLEGKRCCCCRAAAGFSQAGFSQVGVPNNQWQPCP